MEINQKHLHRLVVAMYAVQDFPALDEYGSKIFGRPIRGTWKLFRYIAKTAVADVWRWRPDQEQAAYPGNVEVPTFEEFATFMLHEATHGWCYFLKNEPDGWLYSTGADEELVCWEVSKLVCEMLNIPYQEEPANLCYQFHLLAQSYDMEGLRQIFEKLPAHSRDIIIGRNQNEA